MFMHLTLLAFNSEKHLQSLQFIHPWPITFASLAVYNLYLVQQYTIKIYESENAMKSQRNFRSSGNIDYDRGTYYAQSDGSCHRISLNIGRRLRPNKSNEARCEQCETLPLCCSGPTWTTSGPPSMRCTNIRSLALSLCVSYD